MHFYEATFKLQFHYLTQLDKLELAGGILLVLNRDVSPFIRCVPVEKGY